MPWKGRSRLPWWKDRGSCPYRGAITGTQGKPLPDKGELGAAAKVSCQAPSHFGVLAPPHLRAARSAGGGTALLLPFQHSPPPRPRPALGTAHVGYQPSLSVSGDAGLCQASRGLGLCRTKWLGMWTLPGFASLFRSLRAG